MGTFLFRINRWLKWIGIVTITDMHGVPGKTSNSKQRIAADIRLFWHILLPAANLVPQVALTKFQSLSLRLQNFQILNTDRVYVSADCQCLGNGTLFVSGEFYTRMYIAVYSIGCSPKGFQSTFKRYATICEFR